MSKDQYVKKLLNFTSKDMKIHQKRTIYQGFFKLDEYKVSHQCFDGTQSKVLTREVFERGDAVVLIPYDPIQNKVVLIEQFRPGAIRAADNPWMLEFIAGMFNENEQPIDVAIREAKEEANISVQMNQVSKVMTYLSSPGGMSEAVHMYIAMIDSSNIGGVYGLEEEGEDILVHVMSLEEAMLLLQQGKIANAATIIGLQWLSLNYSRKKS